MTRRATVGGFGKEKRLLHAADYSRVFDNPEIRASHQNVLLLAKSNDVATHRLGLVIAKKNVRLAVQRNRVKRIVREFFRALPATEPALDVVVLARRGMGDLDNAELSSILLLQWRKLVIRATTSETNSHRDT